MDIHTKFDIGDTVVVNNALAAGRIGRIKKIEAKVLFGKTTIGYYLDFYPGRSMAWAFEESDLDDVVVSAT